MQNIEMKARLPHLRSARKIARALATAYLGVMRQRDTYYHVPDGLLKLRQMPDRPAELIHYRRPERQSARACDYTLFRTDDAQLLSTLLSDALGVRVVIEKQREVFLYHSVRIHLDRVKNLGTFLEFEAVLRRKSDAVKGRRMVEFLMTQFGLMKEQLVPVSYGVLLEREMNKQNISHQGTKAPRKT